MMRADPRPTILLVNDEGSGGEAPPLVRRVHFDAAICELNLLGAVAAICPVHTSVHPGDRKGAS